MRYLAESGTGQAFQTRIALANPGPRTAHILLTFLKSDGAPVLKSLELGPTSRTTIYPETIAGLAATEFSTTIDSDEQVLVDRTTSRDGRAYSSHAEGSVAASSKTWYFAEGATHSGSNLFYVIQNRTTAATDVVVRYLLAAPRTSITKTYSVAAMSRRTIWVNDEARTDPNLSALAAVDVSAALTATVPVVVERQVFADRNGQSFAVGHGSPGAPAAAPDWFFAEGATGSFYDMSLSIANPSPATATIDAEYRLPSGAIVSRRYSVPAGARTAILVDDEDARLADTAVSASLHSANGVGFVAERSMRWVSNGSSGSQETHTSAGTSAAATEWGIAEGEVGGPGDTDTFLAVSNSSASPASARIALLFEDGTTAEQVIAVPAGSRVPVSIAQEFASAAGRKFGVVVSSLGKPASGLIVEWAMYSATSGPGWIPATNSVAQPLSAPVSTVRAAVSAPTVAAAPDSRLATASLAPSAAVMASTDASAVATVASQSTPGASTFNLKVVSNASPDLTDLQSLVDSTTSLWVEKREKVWALFYWSHILKRQTAPIVLHGTELTDPIRNLTDYGYTMCSTVTGINQSLYEAIGLRHQYWDICNHTVSAVEYDGKFHMVDSSMSNLVTNDDGVTLATVQEAAADAARLVRERSLYSTSPNGFLTGTDAIRSLPDVVNPADGAVTTGFAADFCSASLKYRDYYYNWNSGHRYVLNLREDETYTRYYRPLGTTSDYWIASEKVALPDPAQTFQNDSANRFGMRGNGSWTFTPKLTVDGWARAAYRSSNIVAGGGGLRPDVAAQTSEVVYKVEAANVIASQKIEAQFARTDPLAAATLSISVNHGTTWTDVGTIGSTTGSAVPLTVNLHNEVTGSYETLLRVQMLSDAATPDGVILTGLTITTLTQVNIKALPRLNLGRNEMYVTLGDQSDTMVLWPDLRGDLWKKDVYDSSNIAAQPVSVPRTYTAVAYPAVLNQNAYLTYRMDAPTDITRFVYGARLHNYQTGSYIDFLYSIDGGVTWTRSYHFTSITKPNDVIHYETVTGIPAGVRTVLFKYLIHNTYTTATHASGLYSARMEVNHRPANDTPAPLDVTLRWNEVRADRTTVARTHHQRVTEFPFKYIVNVAGSDHPVMDSVTVKLATADDQTPDGYGNGVDPGGDRYLYRKQTVGTNFALKQPYTFSRGPSGFQSSAPATNTTILTDGVVGSPVTGSFAYWLGQCWSSGSNVDLRVDLGQLRTAGAFRAHLFGSPGWDALKGQVLDRIEVLTSMDGAVFTSQGLLQTSLWKKDIPINYMLPDDEKATAWNFELVLPTPVEARYVTYHITPKRILCASELQVLDRIGYDPFDIRIAPPSPFTAPQVVPVNIAPSVTLTSPGAADTFVAPAAVPVTAAAQDPDGTIQRVEFFSGSSSIGIATASPFTVTIANVPPGQYVLTALATDDAGAQTTSQPVVINVTSANAVAVPAVVGLTEADATAAITAAGFALGTVSRANSNSVAAGTVLSESPAAGAMAAAGSSVALVVSLGPAGVTVPNVVGQTQTSATAALTGAGLTVGAVSTATSTSVANGNVISQTPGAGASVAPGASVALVVSSGPPVTPSVPAPWATQDIGAVGKAGSASFAGATKTFSVSGAGADIWGTADALRFVYQTLSGDGEIVARVASVQNTNAWVKAGVMIRADVTPGSAQAMMMVTPGKGNNFQRRLTNGGVSVGTAGALVTAPYWVKLTRAGSTVTASQSSDGATWSTVGSATMTIGADVQVGLAVSSHSTTVVATATFDQVAVNAGSTPGDPPALTVAVPNVVGQSQADALAALVGAGLAAGTVTAANSTTVPAGNVISQTPAAATLVAPGTTVSIVVSSGPGTVPDPALPSPWLTQDVGTVGLAGSASFDAATSTYSATGAGADIWGTADAFRFVYQRLPGDVEIVARVASVQNTNAWVKAGVMIRTDVNPDSAQAMMMVTPGKGNNFQRRAAAGGVSASTAGAVVTAPYWVKLTRVGTSVTAYQSADGAAWTTVGTATIALPTEVLVGLAVSSHSTTTRATATFTDVVVKSH